MPPKHKGKGHHGGKYQGGQGRHRDSDAARSKTARERCLSQLNLANCCASGDERLVDLSFSTCFSFLSFLPYSYNPRSSCGCFSSTISTLRALALRGMTWTNRHLDDGIPPPPPGELSLGTKPRRRTAGASAILTTGSAGAVQLPYHCSWPLLFQPK
eukprot:1143870-Prorocentrum_minimum.AAC.1